MANVFVCSGRDEVPRWQEAFAGAVQVGPDQARARVGAGDLAWVMSNLPGWSELVAGLRRQGATLVVMSYLPSSREAFQALDAGARGYVHALSPPELFRQVELVTTHQGIWVPPELLARVVGGTFQALGGEVRLQDDVLAELTERERAVALAVARGESNKEVARRLDITERTVKAHLGAVFRKLGIRDRMQLVLRLSHQSISLADPGQ
ncbi:DNA-binding NarL/FixJ family response regulator [Halomonas campaniensis]|uniref:DNA-binding NarL/FixJ family response regulator n=1 Tax=Halomonas campaniensis TaxID=213554 RepID=A0A7W5JZK2_9GAMM|nr:response regulator transcription factor [Halomonas campaniensis]MBB3329219.1 DNA-binding NarL/FixJ family response regulator [Halomonas campaniensis]